MSEEEPPNKRSLKPQHQPLHSGIDLKFHLFGLSSNIFKEFNAA
jgi:hypothetical protein